jgi:hypothetical protein
VAADGAPEADPAITVRTEFDVLESGVEPDTGDTELKPEPDDLLDLVADPRVGHVEVRLEGVEPW